MRLSSDKAGMNVLQVKAFVNADDEIEVARKFIFMGGRQLRLRMPPGVDGTITLAQELVEWEIDSMWQGRIVDGVAYLRNFATSGLEISDVIGTFKGTQVKTGKAKRPVKAA